LQLYQNGKGIILRIFSFLHTMPFAYVMKLDKHSFMDPRNIFLNESVAGTEALSPDGPGGESSSCEAWNPGKNKSKNKNLYFLL
jgi:hypothetical protein